jgi:hypothetical protein
MLLLGCVPLRIWDISTGPTVLCVVSRGSEAGVILKRLKPGS